MMRSENDLKDAIIRKYDEEAEEFDTPEWLALDDDVRVPESGAAHYFVARKVAMALRFCGEVALEKSEVLEIGCSFGQMTALLARTFPHLSATDISRRSVELAEKRLRSYGISHVRFSVDDAESLDSYADNSFDIILSFSTLRFCPSPENAMKTIRKKLRPGGIAIVDFPNKKSSWHSFMKPILGIQPHIGDRLYSESEAVELFEKAGFVAVRSTIFLFTSRRLPGWLLPIFRVVDFVLERTPFVSRFAGIIMVKGVR
jgi:ubiquinone/menaquinone biosynthesis C-methylase UbiE